MSRLASTVKRLAIADYAVNLEGRVNSAADRVLDVQKASN